MSERKIAAVIISCIMCAFVFAGCTASERDSSYDRARVAPPELTETLDVTMDNNAIHITAGQADGFLFMSSEPGKASGNAILTNENASVYGQILLLGVGELRDLNELGSGVAFKETECEDADGKPVSFCMIEEKHKGYNKNLWYGLILTGARAAKMDVANNVVIRMTEIYDPEKDPVVTEDRFRELLATFREEA